MLWGIMQQVIRSSIMKSPYHLMVSDLEDIKRKSGISKLAFKRATQNLWKQKEILIKDIGIYLNS